MAEIENREQVPPTNANKTMGLMERTKRQRNKNSGFDVVGGATLSQPLAGKEQIEQIPLKICRHSVKTRML